MLCAWVGGGDDGEEIFHFIIILFPLKEGKNVNFCVGCVIISCPKIETLVSFECILDGRMRKRERKRKSLEEPKACQWLF